MSCSDVVYLFYDWDRHSADYIRMWVALLKLFSTYCGDCWEKSVGHDRMNCTIFFLMFLVMIVENICSGECICNLNYTIELKVSSVGWRLCQAGLHFCGLWKDVLCFYLFIFPSIIDTIFTFRPISFLFKLQDICIFIVFPPLLKWYFSQRGWRCASG